MVRLALSGALRQENWPVAAKLLVIDGQASAISTSVICSLTPLPASRTVMTPSDCSIENATTAERGGSRESFLAPA